MCYNLSGRSFFPPTPPFYFQKRVSGAPVRDLTCTTTI